MFPLSRYYLLCLIRDWMQAAKSGLTQFFLWIGRDATAVRGTHDCIRSSKLRAASGISVSCKYFLGAACAVFATPALADHMGPSALGSGGGMAVFGPNTLDEGRGAAGFRLTYTRPEQRSDAELEALAGQHVHAHKRAAGTRSSGPLPRPDWVPCS